MKRWFLAVAVLLSGALGLAHADYIKIVYNLGLSKEGGSDQQGAGAPGMPGGPGMPGMPGPGMPGMPGGPGMGSGRGGPGMPGPGMPGMPGMGSGRGMGGRSGMGGPGMPGMGSGRGMGGRSGMNGPAMPGMPSGPGMPGMPGGPGMPGMPGYGDNTNPPEEEDEESSPFWVVGIVEVDHKDVKPKPQTGRLEFTHKWGKTSVYVPQDAKVDNQLKIMTIDHPNLKVYWYKVDTVAQRYDKLLKELILKKNGASASDWLELADWAVGHGQYGKVPTLVESAAKLEPKNPAVLAFQKVQAAMKASLTKDDSAAGWKERLGNFNVKQSSHYTLLYDGPAESPPAEKRLQRMEDTYHAFFYWWALKGKVLRVPDRRLVAVLVDDVDAFEYQHKQVFDDVPMVADGFCARPENVAFYCAKRLDEAYSGLTSVTKGLWGSWDRKALLKGEGWKGNQIPETCRAQTLTLLLEVQNEESEINTVSHEGTTQLLAATGLEGTTTPLLPRSVEAPAWIKFGLASFFETPRGAYWPGTGVPSWLYLEQYKKWEDARKLEKPEEALKHVITDHDFRALDMVKAREMKDAKEKDKEVRTAQMKARTMGWALTYFLARERREGLLRYYQELASLPRDMAFDEDMLMGVFGRAFDLTDAGKPNDINPTKFYNLAKEWRDYLRLTSPESRELLNKVLKEQQSELKSGGPKSGGNPK